MLNFVFLEKDLGLVFPSPILYDFLEKWCVIYLFLEILLNIFIAIVC